MKKLLITITFVVLLVSGALIASADSTIQECVTATGFSADICANCIAFFDKGAGDAGPCICKLFREFDPAGFDALFKNFGECVRTVQRDFHN